MSKLESILLIDDSDADNFFHKMVIKRSNVPGIVTSIDGSIHALDFFRESLGLENNEKSPTPQLVFLDINMPAMNGFELLTKVREIPDLYDRKKGMKIFMLTGSLNPDDRAMAMEQYGDLITGFRIKPLTEKVIQEIMADHFPS